MAAQAALAVSTGAPWPEWRQLPGGRQVALGWGQVGREDASALWPAERQALERCRTDKRRQELVAGRVAAHRALALLVPGQQAPVSARTEGQDSGRPFFPAAPDLSLSITHSAGLAVAAVSRGGPLGVDLEQTLRTGEAFLEEAFVPGEREGYLALCAGRMDATTAAWAMKEAVLKVWGVGLRAPLLQVAVRPELCSVSGGCVSLMLRLETGNLPPTLGPPPAVLSALLLAWAPEQVLALAG